MGEIVNMWLVLDTYAWFGGIIFIRVPNCMNEVHIKEYLLVEVFPSNVN